MPPLFDDAIRSLRGDEARGPFRGIVLQRIDHRTALDPQRRVDQRKSPIAMFPTIHRFMEGLLSPRTSLSAR